MNHERVTYLSVVATTTNTMEKNMINISIEIQNQYSL